MKTDWNEIINGPGSAFTYRRQQGHYTAVVFFDPGTDAWHLQLIHYKAVSYESLAQGVPGWETADAAMRYAECQLDLMGGGRSCA